MSDSLSHTSCNRVCVGELVERLYRDWCDGAGPGRSRLPKQCNGAEGRLVDRVWLLRAEGRPLGAGGVRA